MTPELEASYAEFLLTIRSLNLKWGLRASAVRKDFNQIRTVEDNGSCKAGNCPIIAVGRKLSPAMAKWPYGNGLWLSAIGTLEREKVITIPYDLALAIVAVADDNGCLLKDVVAISNRTEFNRLRNMMLDACGLPVQP